MPSPTDSTRRWLKLWLLAQFIAYLSTWGLILAETWLAYLQTSSAAVLGLATLCGWGPVLLLAPLAGRLIDSHGPLKVLKVAQVCAIFIGLLLAGTQALGWLSLPVLLALTSVRGAIAAVDAPARRTVLLRMTEGTPALQPQALTALVVLHQVARVLALLGVGALLAKGSEVLCFLVCTVGFLPLYWQLRRMVDVSSAPSASSTGSFRAVLSYVRQSAPLKALVTQVSAFAFTAAAYVVLIPAYAKEVLGLPLTSMAAVAAASTPGVLVAFWLSKRHASRLPAPRGAFLGAAAGVVALGLTSNVVVAAAALAVTALAQTLASTKAIATAQPLVPVELQGRFNALMVALEAGVPAAVALLAGLALHDRPGTALLVLGAAGCVLTLTLQLGQQRNSRENTDVAGR